MLLTRTGDLGRSRCILPGRITYAINARSVRRGELVVISSPSSGHQNKPTCESTPSLSPSLPLFHGHGVFRQRQLFAGGWSASSTTVVARERIILFVNPGSRHEPRVHLPSWPEVECGGFKDRPDYRSSGAGTARAAEPSSLLPSSHRVQVVRSEDTDIHDYLPVIFLTRVYRQFKALYIRLANGLQSRPNWPRRREHNDRVGWSHPRAPPCRWARLVRVLRSISYEGKLARPLVRKLTVGETLATVGPRHHESAGATWTYLLVRLPPVATPEELQRSTLTCLDCYCRIRTAISTLCYEVLVLWQLQPLAVAEPAPLSPPADYPFG